ncbi:uncharacterized protein [Dermacentor andersoni]|uniref:uncharacterized protein n=1 Tax=Dermacentor andersoni TaxID=34620 RepID=UPI003B3AB16D
MPLPEDMDLQAPDNQAASLTPLTSTRNSAAAVMPSRVLLLPDTNLFAALLHLEERNGMALKLAMKKYLLAGAFSVGTRLSHMELSSTYMRVHKKNVRRKPDLAVHHNSLLVDKYVISGQETPQLTQKKSQSKSVRHWNKTCLPKFSAYLRPLLEGENMQSKTRQRMTAQMRDDVIAFIDENHLIESNNTAIRRWEYRAFCEALNEAYPNMQWETERARKVQKLDCELGWSTFMRSVSTTRKTRKLRMKKRQELSSVSADNGPDRPAISSADAECELKTIRDAISHPANLDVSRIKVLLEATLEARRKSPENELPVYFLNPDVLALEAELRFEASFEDMLAKLLHVRKMLGRTSFIEIDEYLRPKKAEFSLISLVAGYYQQQLAVIGSVMASVE